MLVRHSRVQPGFAVLNCRLGDQCKRHASGALPTIEGEKDDICAVGQTLVVQDLGSKPASEQEDRADAGRRLRRVQRRRRENQIYPIVRGVIHMSS
jgi:poly(3-hydroxybutyrate) depolymerase